MFRILTAIAVLAFLTPMTLAADSPEAPLTMVVMDPLAAPLSCPCVKGYAQRDYTKLAQLLEEKLHRKVTVVFGESLTATLTKKTEGKADIIIGKESVVRLESAANKLTMLPVASLTGKDGKTTMTGLIVVPSKDAAISASDLKEHRIIFGLPECDEKYLAPMSFLKELGVTIPAKPETCASCSDGATKALDAFKKGDKIATVISSYAQPLLEGCGTIQKGDLRVVGETEPVPFVVAFVNEKLSEEVRSTISKELLGVGENKALSTALETKSGFVPWSTKKK